MSVSFWDSTRKALILSIWVVAVFLGVQFILSFVYGGILYAIPALADVNAAVSVTIFAALVYICSFLIVTGVPVLLHRQKVSRSLLGIDRNLAWSDIGLGFLAVLPYFLLSAGLVLVVSAIWSGLDPEQKQSIPFQDLTTQLEYLVAFATLVVLAPIAEELLFRGYLQGSLRKVMNKWSAVVLTAVLFGSLHLMGDFDENGVVLQWAAGIDTFALGLVLASLREFTGSVYAGILLHMLKNAIAFYFLFIYPMMAGTL
ncbi:MAG TPA: type II CAAX endopeptidase family protein [Candidatus Saccharibacteria bacterium]|nr:type II CAAX endopeptidase family protein [Candidatus Saccharibacteria bacterium]